MTNNDDAAQIRQSRDSVYYCVKNKKVALSQENCSMWRVMPWTRIL